MTVYYCQMCGEKLDTTKKDGDAWYCHTCHHWSADPQMPSANRNYLGNAKTDPRMCNRERNRS